MCGQVHCLHSLLPPATNHSVRHRPKGHHFDLPRYNYDLSRKRFVLSCLYEFKQFFFDALFVFHCVPFCLYIFIFIHRKR